MEILLGLVSIHNLVRKNEDRVYNRNSAQVFHEKDNILESMTVIFLQYIAVF